MLVLKTYKRRVEKIKALWKMCYIYCVNIYYLIFKIAI